MENTTIQQDRLIFAAESNKSAIEDLIEIMEELDGKLTNALTQVEVQENALKAALHDLETSAGLHCCDNEEGRDLFQLEHQSIDEVRKALGVM